MKLTPELLAHIEAVEAERDALRTALEEVRRAISDGHHNAAIILMRDALATNHSPDVGRMVLRDHFGDSHTKKSER